MDELGRSAIGMYFERKGRPSPSALVIGGLLIGLGIIFFLSNVGLLPTDRIGAYWPLIPIFLAVVLLRETRTGAALIVGVTVLVGGLLLLMGNLDILRVTWGAIWPLSLIAVGAIMLIHRMRWGGFPDWLNLGSNLQAGNVAGGYHEMAIFSSIKRRVNLQAVEAGELSTIFGSIDLDLRKAILRASSEPPVLEMNAIFGAIDIRVPEQWRIILQGAAIFGSFEDKTLPPRPEPGVETPTLIVGGASVFGSVTVKN